MGSDVSDRLMIVGFGEAERNALKAMEPIVDSVLGGALEDYERRAGRYADFVDAAAKVGGRRSGCVGPRCSPLLEDGARRTLR